jgi:methionyl aminopeptidase
MSNSELVVLKDEKWLACQKHAGHCVSNILKECGSVILEKKPNLNLQYLESIVFKYCKLHNCIPTFLGYDGFPSAACISVNKAMVHGIVTDYELQPGDIVSVDVGATYKGAIADAARTWIYGKPLSLEHSRLLKEGYNSLLEGQKQVVIGNRLGSIGNSIYKYATKHGYGVVTNYGGHGLEYDKAHTDPFVANKQQPNDGIRITNGLSIAIEPMLVIGEAKTKIEADGWTVTTPNIGCHFENSVTVWENKAHIITEVPYEGIWSIN